MGTTVPSYRARRPLHRAPGRRRSMSSAVPIIRQAGEGEQLWFAGGGLWTLKASAAETAEAFMLLEFRAERGKVTPLHLHPEEDEGFYVLDGEVLVHVE